MNDAQGERLTKFFRIFFGLFSLCLLILGVTSWIALVYKFTTPLPESEVVYWPPRRIISEFFNPFSGTLLIAVGLWILSLVFPKSVLNLKLEGISWIFSTLAGYLVGYGIFLVSLSFIIGLLWFAFWPLYILIIWKVVSGLSPKRRNLVLVLLFFTLMLHFELVSDFVKSIVQRMF